MSVQVLSSKKVQSSGIKYEAGERIHKFSQLVKRLDSPKWRKLEDRGYFDPAKKYPAVLRTEIPTDQVIRSLEKFKWTLEGEVDKLPSNKPGLTRILGDVKKVQVLSIRGSYPLIVAKGHTLGMKPFTVVYMPEFKFSEPMLIMLGLKADPKQKEKDVKKAAEGIAKRLIQRDIEVDLAEEFQAKDPNLEEIKKFISDKIDRISKDTSPEVQTQVQKIILKKVNF